MTKFSSSNFGRTENMVSYSAVAGRNQQASNSNEWTRSQTIPRKVSASTQTTHETEMNARVEQVRESVVKEFQKVIMEKLQTCLLEIFAGTEKGELSKRSASIARTIKLHLNTTIPQLMQFSQLSNNDRSSYSQPQSTTSKARGRGTRTRK